MRCTLHLVRVAPSILVVLSPATRVNSAQKTSSKSLEAKYQASCQDLLFQQILHVVCDPSNQLQRTTDCAQLLAHTCTNMFRFTALPAEIKKRIADYASSPDNGKGRLRGPGLAPSWVAASSEMYYLWLEQGSIAPDKPVNPSLVAWPQETDTQWHHLKSG